jgi:PIN like domain
MKDAFRHYFRPTGADFDGLWQNALFSFDDSVLLNIYGYSRDTREELISFLETNAVRLRLPYQFGLEYARNRCSTIMKQVKYYDDAMKALDIFRGKFLDPRHQHPYLKEPHRANFDAILADLATSRQEMRALITSDPYLDRLLLVFAGKVGAAPTDAELTAFHKEAKERYDANKPPGFADLKQKGAPGAYGDYVGWRQLISISKSESKGMLFITDDTKDDWWHIEEHQNLGPLPELLLEFAQESQQALYLYTSESFLRLAKDRGVADISESVIEEVGDHLARERESEPAGETDKLTTADKSEPDSVAADESEWKAEGDLKDAPASEPDKAVPAD